MALDFIKGLAGAATPVGQVAGAVSSTAGAVKAVAEVEKQRDAENNRPAVQAAAETQDENKAFAKLEADIARGDLAAVQRDEAVQQAVPPS